MTSREIVSRTVHFQNPARRAYFCQRFGFNDVVNVFDFFLKDENGVDPWGTRFENLATETVATIGIPKTPPLADPSDIGKLTIPDPRRFAGLVRDRLARLSKEEAEKHRVIFTSSGIWERIQYFRGMEQIMCDMIEEPEFVHQLVNLCTDFWVAFIGELSPVRGELDALYMFDDWGTQKNAMISPELWREFFGPCYRRITGAAHANGMDFWLHSCGKVTRLIDDFIEVGMDLINPYQSGICGYEEVAAQYAGRIAFLTTVDTQTTLPHGTRGQVLAECPRLEKWGTANGGLIIASYGFDIPEENERAVFDYFRARDTNGN